jgi:hypothetical protein
MLVCRLEILTLHSSSEEPAHLIMQPHEWGSVQWCTGKWHIFGGSCERTSYMLFGWWISGLICIKPILSYTFQNFLFKILNFSRVEITPKYYIVASYVALGAIQQSWNSSNHHPSECMALSSYLRVSRQILVIQNRWWDFSIHSMSRDSIVHNWGRG